VFVKPAHEGSSVGAFAVSGVDALRGALTQALAFDSHVLVEPMLPGPEYTVGIVRGLALPVIGIRPAKGFYDYDEKRVGTPSAEALCLAVSGCSECQLVSALAKGCIVRCIVTVQDAVADGEIDNDQIAVVFKRIGGPNPLKNVLNRQTFERIHLAIGALGDKVGWQSEVIAKQHIPLQTPAIAVAIANCPNGPRRFDQMGWYASLFITLFDKVRFEAESSRLTAPNHIV